MVQSTHWISGYWTSSTSYYYYSQPSPSWDTFTNLISTQNPVQARVLPLAVAATICYILIGGVETIWAHYSTLTSICIQTVVEWRYSDVTIQKISKRLQNKHELLLYKYRNRNFIYIFEQWNLSSFYFRCNSMIIFSKLSKFESILIC